MERNSIDERLIRRGELLLSLEFVDGYDRELRVMNRGKVSRPYVLTERYGVLVGCTLPLRFSLQAA